MFEFHGDGIIEELKSVSIMVSVLSISLSLPLLLMLGQVAVYRECTAEGDMFVKSVQ